MLIKYHRLNGFPESTHQDANWRCSDLRSRFALLGKETKKCGFRGGAWVTHRMNLSKNVTKVCLFVPLGDWFCLFVWQKKILIATCSSTSPLVRRHRRVPHSNASPKPTPTSPQWSVGSVGEESTVKTQRLRSGPWDDRFEAWIWDKKKEATQKMTKTKRTKCSQSFSGHKVKVEILNKNR